MRLSILDRGHAWKQRAFLMLVRVISRGPAPDILKLLTYRPDFFGNPINEVFEEAMRGPSPWSVGDRELMASFISKTNECEFWMKAHAAVAAKAYSDDKRVAAVLEDFERAPISEQLRATLRMLRKLTHEHTLTADDMRAVLAAGVTKPQIESALAVAYVFNIITRLADAFEFAIPDARGFQFSAKLLLTKGYKLPS